MKAKDIAAKLLGNTRDGKTDPLRGPARPCRSRERGITRAKNPHKDILSDIKITEAAIGNFRQLFFFRR